ncbi:hypothetical protein ACFSSA_05635 [Luteolibacter algae]|uniref:Glucose/Sorbosone dehydrogenase domain-containing protein n=1 Tax=Luteolibacter algae TaxID=454151 RepID=A0ABW5D715_9BACT
MSSKLTLLTLLLAGSFTSQSTAEVPKILPEGFSVETIPTPLDENGKPLFFDIGGIAFTEDGTAVVASRLHGIWKYHEKTWSQFCDSLHDPLGIHLAKPDGSAIVIAQKPELTGIEDTDRDGKADAFNTLADQWRYAGNYCEYVHGPVVDKAGNYFISINSAHIGNDLHNTLPPESKRGMGSFLGYDGWAAKITEDGKFIPYASGFRSAAGIGISPEDELFITDNQGDWVGTSTLYHVRKGGFYGHPGSLADLPEYRTGSGKNLAGDAEHLNGIRTLPTLLLPHGELVNSPGNPAFNTITFGPFQGQIFMGCQTRSNIVRADLQLVKGEYQGVVFNFIDHLQSGCLRLTFSPQGELWVGQTGRGWRSQGSAEYGLQKVKWDGSVPFEIRTIKLTSKGFRVEFTRPADLQSLTEEDISVNHWFYKYSKEYGSPKMDERSETPKIIGRSADGLSMEFEVPLFPQRLYHIAVDVRSPSGERPSVSSGYYTLNKLMD